MLKRILVACLVLVLIVWLGKTLFFGSNNGQEASKHTDKVLFTDLAGKEVWLDKDIDRIILLRSKDIYSLAVLLGDELPEKLIAWGPDLKTDSRGTYDKFIHIYPALEKIPFTGSVYSNDLSVEQILNLEPDLIVADKYLLDKGYWYMDKLVEAGLPVVCLDGSSDPFEGAQKGVSLLGEILGKEQKASEINSYVNGEIDSVLGKINRDHPAPPNVYLEAGSGGPEEFAQTYGGVGIPKTYTSWGTVLNRLQVNNIAEDIGSQMGSINPEYLLSSDPDVIIITGQNWDTSSEAMKLGDKVTPRQANDLLKGFTNRSGWNELQAVKNKRFHSVFHNSASIVCFAAIEALAKFSYPEEFETLDPEEDLKTFYDKFMPIEYSGVWMKTLE